MTKPPLLLVGYGRFGRLAAEILRGRFAVHVLERRRNARLPRWVRRAQPRDLGAFGIVLLALPADPLRAFLERRGSSIRPDAFVADLCAVKAAPMRWMRRWLPRTTSFAGLHPLFGPDSFGKGAPGPAAGLPAARPSMAFCPGRISPACRRRLLRTIRTMGIKPLETTASTHDRMMAYTLFLTQLIGCSLPAAITRPRSPLSTPSVLHLREIASRARNNAPHLLGDLLRHNPHCRTVHRRFLRGLRRGRSGPPH